MGCRLIYLIIYYSFLDCSSFLKVNKLFLFRTSNFELRLMFLNILRISASNALKPFLYSGFFKLVLHRGGGGGEGGRHKVPAAVFSLTELLQLNLVH